MVTTHTHPQNEIRQALSALLLALGFDAMAAEVLTETDHDRLCRYARIIVKNTPESKKHAISIRLRILRLI